MKIGADLLKILAKTYQADTMVQSRFRGNDIAFKTDEQGNPVLLFVGKADEQGKITGLRYTRVLKRNKEGLIIKDHWEQKGKAS